VIVTVGREDYLEESEVGEAVARNDLVQENRNAEALPWVVTKSYVARPRFERRSWGQRRLKGGLCVVVVHNEAVAREENELGIQT
jgi:hypothetical protein